MLIRVLATVLTSSAALSFALLLLGTRFTRTRPTPAGFRRIPLGLWQIEVPSVGGPLAPLDAPYPGGSA